MYTTYVDQLCFVVAGKLGFRRGKYNSCRYVCCFLAVAIQMIFLN